MKLDPMWLLDWLTEYKYAAMVSILLMCGVGLPVPEEVTLITSGLMVGWHEADFVLASACCCFGILAGDSVIFALGRVFGQRFFRSRPISYVLSPARIGRVKKLFDRHGTQALFIARFLPGVRIGVYAYAGAEGVPWWRFFSLDLLGVLVSAPTSIWAGRFIAQAVADDRQQAVALALQRARAMGHWFIVGAVLVLIGLIAGRVALRRLFSRP